jgi:hypothetical protein
MGTGAATRRGRSSDLYVFGRFGVRPAKRARGDGPTHTELCGVKQVTARTDQTRFTGGTYRATCFNRQGRQS